MIAPREHYFGNEFFARDRRIEIGGRRPMFASKRLHKQTISGHRRGT
jgi:hypothetical protein